MIPPQSEPSEACPTCGSESRSVKLRTCRFDMNHQASCWCSDVWHDGDAHSPTCKPSEPGATFEKLLNKFESLVALGESNAVDRWSNEKCSQHVREVNETRSAVLRLHQEAVERAVGKERERCAKLAEAYLHSEPTDDKPRTHLDSLGMYSNGTVHRIAAAIRGDHD